MRDIDRKTLNYIIFEASRFGARPKERPSEFKNYFTVEIEWDDAGKTRKQILRNFDEYRLWWIRNCLQKHWDSHKKFWDAIDKGDSDNPK